MSSITANTVLKSNTATIAPSPAANASASKRMTSSGSKAVGGATGGDQQQQPGGQQTKPPAWTRSSLNPITGRASGSPVQNGTKSNGAAPSTTVRLPSAASKDSTSSDKLSFLFANMRGLNATLLLKNGDRYNGIFSTVADGRYIIKMAKKLPSQGGQANGVAVEQAGSGPDRTLSLNVNEVVDLHVNDVRFDKAVNRGQNGASSNFRTDTDISQGWRGRERDLQKWEPTDNGTDVDLSVENGSVGAWDQFAAHKKMTGLESTYDENHYTTPLNRSRADFDEAARRADKIAREIEGSSATNAHIAEERGIKAVDDSGLDEEAKYSGVHREYKPLTSSGANRYTPPAMRAPTGQATVPGAPVDPAIISSSFAKPKTTEIKKVDTPATTPAEVLKPTVAKDTVAPSPAASKPAVADKVVAPAPVPSQPATKPAVTAAISAARPANKEGGATATVEKDVHEAFREFNKQEKLRVQEHQRSVARRDKAVKLNDLKKFAQNFKLHTEVPADLLPILARDEIKQREIREKAKKHAEEKSTPPRSAATSVTATPSETKSKPTVSSRTESSGPTSPLVTTTERQPQRSRQSSTNMGGSIKGNPPHMQTGHGGGHRQHGNLGPRLAMNTGMNNRGMPQHQPGPIPDPRMAQATITSPGGALRFDPTKSFIPSAASKSFVPGGPSISNSSSPVRAPSSQPFEPKAPTPGNLFEGRTDGRKGLIPASERVSLDNAFNPIPTLREENLASVSEEKRAELPNAGLPPPHKTQPIWDNLVPAENKEKGIKDMFPNTSKPAASPQHVAPPNQFQHQIPAYGPHPGYVPQPGLTPSQTPRHHHVQPHHGGPGTPHHYEEAQRMQFSQSTSSVHPSPRPVPGFMYNPNGGPPNHNFPPQMGYGSPAGGYGMMTRQLSNNPHFQGQAPQMVPMQGAVYMNGVPGPVIYPGGQPQAFFAHQHMLPQPGMNGSPANRPVMMANQGSQSGHNTPQVMTPYFQAQGPAMQPGQQMRYAGGPQHHGQFVGQPQGQHYGGHPMRGGGGGYPPQQGMVPPGGPQGMAPMQGGPPPPQQQAQDGGAGGEDGK